MNQTGLLLSDDLSMQALDGALSVRAKQALFAGCDLVLHCNGNMDEMQEVASVVKELKGPSLKRSEHALAHLSSPGPFDPEAAEFALRADLQFAECILVEIRRVRVESREHSGNRLGDELLVFDRLDIVGFDAPEHFGERPQFLDR